MKVSIPINWTLIFETLDFHPNGFGWKETTFSATMPRGDMIQRALDAPIPEDYSTYLQHVLMIHEKFSRALQSHISRKFPSTIKVKKWGLTIQKPSVQNIQKIHFFRFN